MSDAGEPKPMPIHRVVVFIFTGSAGEFGAAFVQDAGEDYIASEAHSRTARRSLRQVRTGIHGRGLSVAIVFESSCIVRNPFLFRLIHEMRKQHAFLNVILKRFVRASRMPAVHSPLILTLSKLGWRE